MKKSRKEFIKEAHSSACSEWKYNIEKEFPELFKKDPLEVGKWYKSEIATFKVTSVAPLKSYGIYSGKWANDNFTNITTRIKPATDKEVEEALIKEAKKRGFKENVRFKCLYNHDYKGKCIPLFCSDGYLWLEGGCVFKDGKWATIVETITKEQAEKELGKTILN
jgi:hypothetical protein